MHRLLGLAMLLGAAYLATSGACTVPKPGDEPVSTDRPAHRPPAFACADQESGLKIELDLDPQKPGIGRNKLFVSVKDKTSNLFVEVQKLTVEPWMPAHGHGPLEPPKQKKLFKGSYEIYPIYFTMAGEWWIRLRLRTARGESARCLKVEVGSFRVEQGGSKGQVPQDSTPPVLQKPVVPLDGAWDASSKSLGSLKCDVASPGCLLPFGHDGLGFISFRVKPGTAVSAAVDGIVESIVFSRHSHVNHSDLYRVTTRAHKDSAFFIEYRNLKGVAVKVGDGVKAGQKLGLAGDGSDTSHDIASFGISRRQEERQWLCPEGFFSGPLRSLYAKALSGLIDAGVLAKGSSLCRAKGLLCTQKSCEKASDFVEVRGDVDSGRRSYKGNCASCHGDKGQGGIGSDLCIGAGCRCVSCKQSHETLSRRIGLDMPPEGECKDSCADDVAAFILRAFRKP